MDKARITKTARTLIRLKHSLAADEEINAVLPATLGEYDEALARGEFTGLRVALEEVLGGDDAPGA